MHTSYERQILCSILCSGYCTRLFGFPPLGQIDNQRLQDFEKRSHDGPSARYRILVGSLPCSIACEYRESCYRPTVLNLANQPS